MAEERKKPKIDLKTRIPSKTVKGLAPIPGGAIPPPPGAVPAPPPDLMGKRTVPPKFSADPNDPLGAARLEGGSAPPQQQIVVVHAAEHEGVHSHASKKGVFYAIVAGVLVGGLGIGFLLGSATAKGAVKSKATSDAQELYDKVTKTNEGLTKFLDTLTGAKSELASKGFLEQPTIESIKSFSSGLSTADLKSREIAYFGEDTAAKLLTYAQRVNHIDELRAGLTRGSALEATNTQLKSIVIPPKQSRYGVQLSRPSPDAPITTASIVDFGAPLDLKNAVDAKADKLKTKNGELDVWPGKGDFLEKAYVSAIDGKDWVRACPVYSQTLGNATQNLQEIVTAIEGSGDDPGTLKPGQDLATKLKTLGK